MAVQLLDLVDAISVSSTVFALEEHKLYALTLSLVGPPCTCAVWKLLMSTICSPF